MGNQVKYDAFISYRHCEADKFVAETLHERLEAYKLPKKLKKKLAGGRTKINRVFRDKDELPLTSNLEDPIMQALSNSDFLIVICSPRLKESVWCRKEIETFISMHGREHVLAVLIEGEPEDSFPDELLYVYEPVMYQDGTMNYVKKPMEPLAADFRGGSKKEIKKAMKEEILRLLAPMFNVNYDDLKQRHRERKMKRVMGVAAVIAGMGVLFGGYFALTAMKIKKQNVKILEQSEVLEEQAEQLASQADILEAQNEILRTDQAKRLAEEAEALLDRDDREGAIRIAYQAITQKDGIDFPYTPEAQKALTSALAIYDASDMIVPVNQIVTPGIVEDMVISPGGKYMITFDSLCNLILWDVEAREELISKELNSVSANLYRDYGFLGDDAFYYLSEEGALVKVNIESQEESTLDLSNELVSIIMSTASSVDGSKIYVRTMNNIIVVDSATMTEVNRVSTTIDAMKTKIYVSENQDEIYYYDTQDGLKFCCTNITSGEVMFATETIRGDAVKCVSKDNILYVSSYSFLDNYNGKSYIQAIDKATGELIWEKEEIGHMTTEIMHSVSAGRDSLLCTFGNLAWLLDAQTGELVVNMTLNGDALYCGLDSDGDFIIYNSNGTGTVISADTEKIRFQLEMMECTELSMMKLGDGYILGVPVNENRVVFYRYCKNADCVACDGLVAEAEKEGIKEEVVEWALENNLPKASYIYSYLEIPDINKTLVGYKDETIEVYQSESMELLYTYNIYGSRLDYLGKVNDYYIVCIGMEGLLFNENGELCTVINNLIGLTTDKSRVVIYGRDDELKRAYFSLPVYTLDEIMEKAEKRLEQ